jgi:hypothetical protein
MLMLSGDGLRKPQCWYWVVCFVLIVGGAAATIWGGPFEVTRPIVKELGPGIFTAGILAAFVDRFFRQELARDAFLASFRYILPNEFKDEVEKIIRFDFIAEKQIWTVRIDRVDDDHVRVTTTYERTFKNKSKNRKPAYAWYEVEDYNFPHGPTEIVECGIQVGSNRQVAEGPATAFTHYRELKTTPIELEPEASANVWGKAIQFRRANDIIYETFRTPIVNPEIEVVIDEEAFEHVVTFGTLGDKRKSQFGNRYTLSGVYFPGQYMFVRWWPKQGAVAAAARNRVKA